MSHVASDSPTHVDVGGTKIYLAPERLFHLTYDESSDLFSAGIVFFELLFKTHPFYREGENYAEYMKKRPDPRFPAGYREISKTLLEILCSMLSYNPKNRYEVRNNILLNTNYMKLSMDHQTEAMNNIKDGEEAERCGKFSEAAIHFSDASLNLSISKHETDNLNAELKDSIINYRKRALHSIYLYKHSFNQFKCSGTLSMYDEYYEYLMEVTASTPTLKYFIEIGYNGELYLCENKREIAFKNFMDALQYLNQAMLSEPSGDRKSIIGKKVRYFSDYISHSKYLKYISDAAMDQYGRIVEVFKLTRSS